MNTCKLLLLILVISVLCALETQAQNYTPDIQIGHTEVAGLGHSAPQASFVAAVERGVDKLFQSGMKQYAVGGEQTLYAQITVTPAYVTVTRGKNAHYPDGTRDEIKIESREFVGYDVRVVCTAKDGSIIGKWVYRTSPDFLGDGSPNKVAGGIIGTGAVYVEKLRREAEDKRKSVAATERKRKGGKP